MFLGILSMGSGWRGKVWVRTGLPELAEVRQAYVYVWSGVG
jgi:hypothetical protein